jgi:hypothetical protein
MPARRTPARIADSVTLMMKLARAISAPVDLEMRLDRAGVGEDFLVEGVPDFDDELRGRALRVQCGPEERGQGLSREDVEIDDDGGDADELRLLVSHEAEEHRVAGIAPVGDQVLRVDARRCPLSAHLRIGQGQACRGSDAPLVDAHAPPQVVRHDAALERADQGHQEEVPRFLSGGRRRTLSGDRAARSRAGGREVLEDEPVEAVARRREGARRHPQHPLADRGEVEGHLPGEQVDLGLQRDPVRHRRVALEIEQ